MARFRKRSPEVEAVQYMGDTEELPYDMGTAITRSYKKGSCFLDTPEGSRECRVGDWIVRYMTDTFRVYATKDLEAVFEPLECVPGDGEPSFTVLGRDQLAQTTVVHWIQRARAAQVPEDKIRRAMVRYQEIVDWQSDNPDKVKTPD